MDYATALPGAWLLQEWSLTDERGTRYPFGRDAIGLICYTPDGYMSATVARRDRPVLQGDVPSHASEAELAAALLSFFTYAGRWRIEGDEVVHEPNLALNPNTVGQPQRRHLHFDHLGAGETVGRGTTLDLTAVELIPRGERRHRLSWRRP